MDLLSSALYIIVALVLLSAQWIGVLVLAKAGRNAGWWTMLVGTFLSTLASITTFYIQFIVARHASSSIMIWYQVTGAAHSLAALLFFAGFIIHGLIVCRMSTRIGELEKITTAQAEEIRRLQEGSR